MNEVIDIETLDEFENITSYNVKSFIKDYLDFIDTKYSHISNFFSGSSTIVPTDAINELNSLTDRQLQIINLSMLNAPSLSNYKFWILIEYIEDIGSVLETANNISKWLRSSLTKTGYKKKVLSDLMLGRGQGLEDVERDSIKSVNFQETWVDTALQNELKEEDYNLNGGVLIKAILNNSSSLFLIGVVDNIDTAEKTYGLDIDRSIKFISDDLATLSYKDTIFQCADILAGLKRGDDPYFNDRGVLFKGGNVAGISYQIIFRDLAALFATDDSFKSFSINDVKRDGDALYVDYTLETKAGDFFNKSAKI